MFNKFLNTRIQNSSLSIFKKLQNNIVYSSCSFSTNEKKGVSSPGLFKTGTEEEVQIGQAEKHRVKFNSKEEKELRIKLLKREITTNPEFFNAFPYLKEKIKAEEIENPAEDASDYVHHNFSTDTREGHPELEEKKTDYFQSLLNKHKGYSVLGKLESEKKVEDQASFVDGYHTSTGPIKFMTKDEKEKIHLEIDKKMRELEESGLSREEILFNKPEGLPLRQDKFFQFIKNNKIAREMLVKPTETLSADLVIEKALKQDIGPDGSLALKKKNFKMQEDLPHNYEMNKYKERFNPKKPDEMLRDDDYDYKTNYGDKLKVQLNAERTKPITFINPPLMRSQLRRKFMIKTIQKKDIVWRNLPLLVRFLNEGGKIMNRFQTRLPGHIHKKLARTVKHARNMGLLPFIDFIKPYHKLPFTSLYNEFTEDTAKVVDKKTGMIKIIHQPTLQDKYTYSSYDSAVEANKYSLNSQEAEKFIDTLLLDHAEMPFVPSIGQRDLLLAQNYLIKQRSDVNKSIFKGKAYNPDSLLNQQEQEAYERVFKEVTSKTSPSCLIESFISEKSYDVNTLKLNQKTFMDIQKENDQLDADSKNRYTKKEMSDTIEQINQLIMKHKINEVLPVNYEKENKKFKNYKIEPNLTQKEMKKSRKGASLKNYKF